MKLPTLEEVTITITPSEEHDGPEGDFSSGDEEQDKKTVADIRREMQWNIWAWCMVRVRVSWNGQHADSFLGHCSYKDEAAFKEGGYYEQMRDEAYDTLCGELEHLYRALTGSTT